MRATLEREAFSQRLREALRRVGDDGSSPTRLAREFNRRYPGRPITLHAARKWLQGEALPAQDKMRVLADWLGVSAEWLRFGEGGKPSPSLREPALVAVDYDLAREVAALSSAHQGVVRALVKALRKSEAIGH
jgi:hypothetical protein